ncbi:winged helix-turn-helix domain-containing protein [Paremcibacter congregatus]|uniref:winged helix-turn-helix domain-containing protein n=1 Tax=Paremcibacter congregatus TaxID=2043170 RepID=UPI003A90ECF9
MTTFDHKEINDVIHGRVRLAIMSCLASAPPEDSGETAGVDFTQLKQQINVSDGNLSTHMTKLEEAGYLEITKQFKGKRPQTICRLTSVGREAFLAYVAHLESLLPPKL